MTEDGIKEAADLVTPEAVKGRARAVVLKLLDNVDSEAPSMVFDRVITALNAVAKFTDAVADTGRGGGVNINLGSLHLDSLRRVAAAPALPAPVDATILPNDDEG